MSKTSSYTKGYLSMNQNCSMENMKEEVSIDGKKHGWNEGAFGKIPPPILIGLSPPSITNKLNLYILSICACAVYEKIDFLGNWEGIVFCVRNHDLMERREK